MSRTTAWLRRQLAVGSLVVLVGSSLAIGGPVVDAEAAPTGWAEITDPRIFLGQRPTMRGRIGERARPIVLQRKIGSSWVRVAREHTDQWGRFELRDSAARTGYYRAVAPRVRLPRTTLPRWVSRESKVLWQTALEPNDQLQSERGIRSPDGRFQLMMQDDGNLVLLDTSTSPATPRWSTQTQSADRAVMQADGNLVVYAGGAARWSSSTAPANRARLVLQDDGNLVMYSRGGLAVWSSQRGLLPNTSDALTPGSALQPGMALWSRNGQYRAVMQHYGNFAVYQGSTATWGTGTSSRGSRVVLQSDGNLVVYDGDASRWSSGTAPASHTRLTMQDDGNLVLRSRGGLALWSGRTGRTGFAEDTLPTGTGLAVNQSIWSHDGRFQAIMQADGNFVVYGPSGALWASGTNVPGSTVHMQGDGNLVVYAPGGGPLWASNTVGGSNARLVMQNDGNLVIYASSGPTWSSQGGGTPGHDPSTGGYPDVDAVDCSSRYGIYSWCKNDSWYHPTRRFAYRNCTDYVAWKKGMTWSQIQHNGSGHAYQWKAGWEERGRTVSTVPVVGAVAWWGASPGNSFGHVAYVLRVNGDGSAHVGEYNRGGNGTYGERDVRAPYYLY